MRGAGDELSVGERIAFYRVRRGLTQRELGGLVGRSEEWVSSIERGRRQARRIDVLTEVARALRVGLQDLVGQPVLVEDERGDDDVPAVRDALMAPRLLSRVLFEGAGSGEPPDAVAAARYVEHVWWQYQAGRVGAVITALPAMIKTAQALEDHPGEDRQGWAVSARVHHLASTVMSKIGETDLSWIAAQRAMAAGERADDPLVLASAARAGTHAFLGSGRFEDAITLGETAASWLRERMREDDRDALSLFGMLNLRTALAAARQQDRAATTDLLAAASWAADRLGAEENRWQTGFGPANVAVHRFAAALDLGDVTFVAAHAPGVDTTGLPVERSASHLIDTARALSLIARDGESLTALLDAERVAPQLVRHSAKVRETVKVLYRRSAASASRDSPISGLAQRCRAVS